MVDQQRGLRRLFSLFAEPPVFPDDDERTRTAQILHRMLAWMTALLAVAYFVALPFVFTVKLGSLLFLFAITAAVALGWRLLERGEVRRGSRTVIVGTWLAFTGLAFFSGGISSACMLYYVSLAVVTGLLLGRAASIRFAAGSLGAALLMAVLESRGAMPPRLFPMLPFTRWFDLLVAMALAVSTLNLTLRTLESALRTARDEVRERQQTEQALRDSEKRFRLLVQNSSDVLVVIEADGTERFVSPSVERITGFKPEELLGVSGFSLLHPDDIPGNLAALKRLLSAPGAIDRIEYRHRHKNGGYVDIEADGINLLHEPDVRGLVLNVRDVTERKRAEATLREVSALQKAILDHAGYSIIATDAAGVICSINPAGERMCGYTAEELIGKATPALFHDPLEMAQRAQELTERLGETIRPDLECFVAEAARGISSEHEWTYVRKDGSRMPCQMLVTALCDKSGAVAGYLGIAQDISARKRAEQALRTNQSRVAVLLKLSQMTDQSEQELAAFGLEGAIELTASRVGYLAFVVDNEAALHMCSWSHTAMAECAIDDKPLVFPVASTGLWGEAVRQRKPIITNDYEAPNPWKKGCPPGHVKLQRHLNAPLFDGERIVLVAGVGNKTDPYDDGDVQQLTLLLDGVWKIIKNKRAEAARLQLEAELRQSQKMESVGRLAGGVAHDFNNILTSILGHTELLLTTLPPDDSVRADLHEIKRSAERAASLTAQLLAFSRRQVVDPRVIDAGRLLAEASRMLQRLVGEDIHFRFDGKQSGRIRIDPTQMEQVLVNLVVNARDAMPNGGVISLRIGRRVVRPEDARANPEAAPGEYVIIAVSDTGVGIPPPVLERLFEPFFTTKEIGKGTGLGLSMVYGIVKQHGGFVEVHSEVNVGTTFEVCLPLVRETAEELPPPRPEAVPGGHETILLVEDEDTVRELTTRMLERRGYRVLSAAGGEEALAVCGQHAERIDLLLTDVIMPAMNGRDLFDRVRELRPGLRVLFMSGYTDDVISRHGVLDRGIAFLQKPFDYDVLLAKVREALEQ